MIKSTKFPQIAEPWVWKADDITKRDDWIYWLGKADIQKIEAAVISVKKREIKLEDVEKTDFSLPGMEKKFSQMREDLANGLGFFLIKGMPVNQFNQEDLEIALWGIGTHLGVGVSQSFRGDRLGHVMDMSHTGDVRRSYRSPRPLRMHADPVDVVGLLCHKKAKKGGLSLIASSMAVYNSIREEKPNYLPTLFEGFRYRSTEEPPSGDPIVTPHKVPVYGTVDNRQVCFFNGPPIERWIKTNEKPGDPETIEAYEYFHKTTAEEELVYKMDLEIGDIQFLNNRFVLHGRTAFEDYKGLDQKRHMLRLWLMIPEWTQLPPNMKQRTIHDRFGGGVPIVENDKG